MNNWDSKFFFCFHQARKSKQRGKNCGHTHSTGWRSAARYFEDLFPSRRSLSFTTSSTVHMYDFHIFTVIYSLLHRFIWNKYNEHFPVSLVAQLIEGWSGLNFFLFKALFSLLLKQCSLLRRSFSFQIGKIGRNQSSGKFTDSPTNQFLNTFMINLFQAFRVFQMQAGRPTVKLKQT